MNKQAGFTFFEMVIVFVLIAVLAAFAAVRMPSTDVFQAAGFSGVFLHDLRLTSILSMSENARYRIVVGVSSYQIQDETSTPINHPEVGTGSITYPSGVTITPATTVIFDGQGRPYDGGGSPLASTLNFLVASGSESKTVSVTPETGFIQ